ncbi:hypothetical protein E3N88_36824 [Mikania micrantha]|uniref:Protein kinase domain-containing protein n=1 Tax=Mikania micrantha TaxID=192012 RepID=A0A5N6M4R3_9ASTR|nr:hypothetical protein E3N88_36824 [Mikania micrantha]
MFAKGTAIQKSFLVPFFALQAPASLVSWIKGEYGIWTAFLALLVRLFFYIPGELELPFIALLMVILLPYQITNLRGRQEGTVLSLVIAAFLAFQHFTRVGSLKRAFDQVGCYIEAKFIDGNPRRAEQFGCESLCNDTIPAIGTATGCTGFNGCCKLSIPENITSYAFTISYNNTNSSCPGVAFVAENMHQNSYCVNSTNGLGYNCHCKQGYQGNPYLSDGCQEQHIVINGCPKQSNQYCEEGETCVYTHGSYKCIAPHRHKSTDVSATLEIVVGFLAFGAIGYWTYIKLDKTSKDKIKKNFFKKNEGHLLEQQISDHKSCVKTIKVYTAEEMEKATENFSRTRFPGKGGQGTIYKGLFSDGTVVAIKKSNIVDVEHLERFVNEVFILAQINHQNIVKLLGCCLEYEVPLLVYEYLANDTLSQHLHDGEGVLTFSWKDRIRITREVAGALAYLHSYASPAIFHRDIKPGNILLDQNYKAVVSDFGLSRPIPLSRSHLTTQVEGTFGHLDPEKKSVSSSDSGEGLVPRFKYLVKHNQFVEILDRQVMQEAMIEDVFLVAKLAKRCIKTNSKKRPSMEEVVTNLGKLGVVQLELPCEYIIEHELTNY